MSGGGRAKCGFAGRDWQLWIRVVEARHVMWRGVGTRVVARVGRFVQASSSRPASSAPYFGEEFTFTLSVPLEDLLDQVLILSLQQTQKMLPRNRLLGWTQLDICTIWEQPDHQIIRKWALLTHPNTNEPAGFLLVDLAVLGPGDNLRLIPVDYTSSPIEQNLLAPSWAGCVRRCRARYAVRIYFADGLPLNDPPARPREQSWPPGTSNISVPRNSPSTSSSQSSSGNFHGKTTPKNKRFPNVRIAARFLGALLANKKKEGPLLREGSDVEEEEEEEEESLSIPRKAHLSRGFHSCGCKARYLVRVIFAGKVGTTTLQGCDHFQPMWSEEILLSEMFPPLYQRMSIQLLDNGRVIAQHRLHLNRAICDPTHTSVMGDAKMYSKGSSHNFHSHGPLGGVIAKFGPNFLYLSGPPLGVHGRPSAVHSADRGPQSRGRMLIEMRVLCADSHSVGKDATNSKSSRRKHNNEALVVNVPQFRIGDLWRSCDMTLAAVIWDVSLMSRSRLGGKELSLQLTFGSAGDHLLWQHLNEFEARRMLRQSSLSAPRPEPIRATGHPYLHLPFGQVKPVLSVRSKWPWFVPDLRVANHLERLAHFLRLQLTSSGRLLEESDASAAGILIGAVDMIVSTCNTVMAENEEKKAKGRDDESEGTAPLGLSSTAIYRLQQIEEAAVSVLEIGAHALQKEAPENAGPEIMTSAEQFSQLPFSTIAKMYRKAFSLLGCMHDVVGELGCLLPDATLWLIADEKRVAACTLPARWLLSSRKQARRGRFCGRMQSVYLRQVDEGSSWARTKSKYCHHEGGVGAVLAKVEAIFWLGSHRTAGSSVQRLIPGGCVRTRGLLPFAYTYLQQHKYECIAHVYQGRFAPGADSSGLNDPFVRVIFGPHSAQTEVSEATLSPRWKRSLRLPPVLLCGDPADVQKRPPMAVIEAWDRDPWSNEFLGRALIRPRVRLLSENELRPHCKVSFKFIPPTGPSLLESANSTPPETKNGSGDTTLISEPGEAIPEADAEPEAAPNRCFGPLHLQWLPMLIGNTRTGDVLASVELVQLPQDDCTSTETVVPEEELRPKKQGHRKGQVLSSSDCTMMADEFSPELSTYRLEIIFWGLRDLRRSSARPPDHHYVVLEIAGTLIKSSKLDPRVSLNFPDPYSSQILSLPTLSSLLPAVHIKLLRRPLTLLCHQYVATNVIPSVSAFLRDSFRQPTRLHHEESEASHFHHVFASFSATNLSNDNDSSESDANHQDNEKTPLLSEKGSSSHLVQSEKKTGRNVLIQRISDTALHLQHRAETQLFKSVRKWRKMVAPERNTSLPKEKVQTPLTTEEQGPTFEMPLRPLRAKKRAPHIDWWTRYYASLDYLVHDASEDDIECSINPLCRRVSTKRWDPRIASEHSLEKELLLQIYPHELEAERQFESFQDFLYNIELHRGKVSLPEDTETTHREEGRSVRAAAAAFAAAAATHWSTGQVFATLKACVRLERLPVGGDLESREREGKLSKFGDNGRQQVTVRAYIIRAHALHGRQNQSRADPYLSVTFGRHHWNGRDLRQHGVLDPVFGKCVQFQGEFPFDHRLVVRVMDHVGVGGGDRLLGETSIDLENRFYSRHLGGCGLPRRYEERGPNAWRDSRRPTDILAGLCRAYDLPHFAVAIDTGIVSIGDWSVRPPLQYLLSEDPQIRREESALFALLSWHTFPDFGCPLVPAHVETRSLFHPNRPGVEQGKIEMWVDVVPTGVDGPWTGITSTLLVPPPVDVEPPVPRSWELRVIVLQAANVVGTEWSLFYRELASDVYVAGWVGGLDEVQKTDVHYRSINGDAAFNWRFVFRFSYFSAEGRVVIGDRRFPPRFHVALMDYDTFTKDDILGSMSFDLKKLPRPAVSAARCGVGSRNQDDPSGVNTVDLFRVGHARGWWPVLAAAAAESGVHGLAGKVELEFQLLPEDEAVVDPVGFGRKPPHALVKPKRPGEAISILRHPFVGLYYVLWRKNRVKIILGIVAALLIALVLTAVYALPKYLVKRVVGA